MSEARGNLVQEVAMWAVVVLLVLVLATVPAMPARTCTECERRAELKRDAPSWVRVEPQAEASGSNLVFRSGRIYTGADTGFIWTGGGGTWQPLESPPGRVEGPR